MYPPHLEFSFVLNTVLIKARQSVFPFKHEASQFCLDITGQEQQEKCRNKCRNINVVSIGYFLIKITTMS